MRSKSVLWLGALALLALAAMKPNPAQAAMPDGLKRAMVPTGRTPSWFSDRYLLAVEVLGPNVPADKLADIALSVLAQWAHETGRGQHEYCFNLGGWHARNKEPYYEARDNLSPTKQVYRWRAWNDLPNAVAQQLERLHNVFPSAWRLLLEQPTSSGWVEELGRKGYYTASPKAYAQAWAMHRHELARIGR